jgi:hypothetical protein
MPELADPLVILLAGGCTALLLWRLELFTPPAVAAWRRIGRHHHLIDDRPLDERVADHVPALGRLLRETSVPRLLAIANRRESLNAWLLRVIIYVVLVSLAFLVLDFVASLEAHVLPVAPAVCVVAAALFVPLSYLSLQREARRRQDAINRAIAQSLTEMAILTYAGEFTPATALEFVARCHKDKVLLELLTGEIYRRAATRAEMGLMLTLRPNQLLSTVTIYQRIGQEYDLEMFRELATNMRRIGEKGLMARDVLTALSEATGKKRLAEMTVRSEQSRPRMALAIGLMVLPLLSLILYPAATALVGAFQ